MPRLRYANAEEAMRARLDGNRNNRRNARNRQNRAAQRAGNPPVNRRRAGDIMTEERAAKRMKRDDKSHAVSFILLINFFLIFTNYFLERYDPKSHWETRRRHKKPAKRKKKRAVMPTCS